MTKLILLIVALLALSATAGGMSDGAHKAPKALSALALQDAAAADQCPEGSIIWINNYQYYECRRVFVYSHPCFPNVWDWCNVYETRYILVTASYGGGTKYQSKAPGA